jgi:hypothetical protein
LFVDECPRRWVVERSFFTGAANMYKKVVVQVAKIDEKSVTH